MKERILKCKDCGKEYVTTAPNSKYCLSCSASRKGNEKIMIEPKYKRMKERKMICKLCGKEYTTSAGFSKYCPGCMIAAQKINAMKRYRKRAVEMAKKIEKEKVTEKVDMVMNEKQVKGDNNTRICVICGKEYIARTDNQKYCPGCVKAAQKTYDIKSYRKKVKRKEGERVLADFQRDLLEFAANNWLPFYVYMLKGAIECVSKGEKTYPIGDEQDGSSKKDGKESDIACITRLRRKTNE